MGVKKMIKSQKRNNHPWRKFSLFFLSNNYSEDQKRVVRERKDTENETRDIG